MNATEKINQKQKKEAIDDPLGATLVYDSWKNIKKENLLDFALVTSQEKTLIWKTKDITSQCSQYQEIILMTEELIQEIEAKEIKINVIVTNSASEFKAAR